MTQKLLWGLLACLSHPPALATPAPPLDDTCATAEVVTPILGPWSIKPNRTINDADPVDHYRTTLEAGVQIEAEVWFSHSDGNLDLRLWNADCTVLLDSSSTTTDDEAALWLNTTGSQVEVVCEVYLVGSGDVEYDYAQKLTLEDCQIADPYEPNDSCANPRVLPFTPYMWDPGNSIQQGDDDWYQVTVPAYKRLDFSFGHDPADGNIDLEVYDAGCSNLLFTVATLDVDERVELENFSPQPMTIVVRAFLADSAACNDYSLKMFNEYGLNYCTSTPNSTGLAAVMWSSGSSSVSTGDLEIYGLNVANVWPKVFGIFFYGPNETSVPFGNGTMCVAQPFVRSPVFQSFKGSIAWPIDYASMSGSIHPITPGSVYNFQCWFRDTAGGGAGFDLTDGYRIAFTP